MRVCDYADPLLFLSFAYMQMPEALTTFG
jgi:hypothetical protein